MVIMHTTLCHVMIAELYDMNGELLDNITVSFETLDTCFCYGHCGCAVSMHDTYILSTISATNCITMSTV